MRRFFEAFDARLEVRNAVFERAHAALQLVVRELDHRLCLGCRALDGFIEREGPTVQSFVSLGDSLGDELDLVSRRFVRNVEVAVRVRVCGSLVVSHRSEQTPQFLIDHCGSLLLARLPVEDVDRVPLFRNETASDQVTLTLTFPSPDAIYDDLVFRVDGRPLPTTTANGAVSAVVTVPLGGVVRLETGYRSQGMDTWHDSFGEGVTQVRRSET